MADPTQPAPALISLRALERALSPQRLAAYRLPEDRDVTDGLARYIWNLALVNALMPALHALEITFRNEIARGATRLNAGRAFTYDRIPSWLDTVPTMLLKHESEKVTHAKELLGNDPKYHTEGHLIAKLDFGFWAALCRDAYSDKHGSGPRLWPRLLTITFQRRPKNVTTRAEIQHRFDRIRLFRNRAAHHEPIWDRNYLAEYDYVLESLSWMSPKLSDTVLTLSDARAVYDVGPAPFRERAERILGYPAP